jgi:hypothetical protein
VRGTNTASDAPISSAIHQRHSVKYSRSSSAGRRMGGSAATLLFLESCTLQTAEEVRLLPSFAQDIRPLFRDSDIQQMRFAFDLSQYPDVSRYADAIAARLADGSMPCDGPWPEDRVALFRQWMDDGCPP